MIHEIDPSGSAHDRALAYFSDSCSLSRLEVRRALCRFFSVALSGKSVV